MQDFNYHFSSCFETTIEVSCCKYPKIDALAEEWKNNLRSILTYLKMANMGIKGIITDRTTGKPIQGYILPMQTTLQRPLIITIPKGRVPIR